MSKFFVKLACSVFFLMICKCSLASICVNMSVNPELNADASLRGQELAFKDNNFSDYWSFSANTNAKFVAQIQQLTVDSCPIVLGLVTSRQCLIAGPVLEKNKIIGFSPLCAHDDVGKFYPYLYTAAPSVSEAAEAEINYLNRTPAFGKVFVIYQPTNVFSEAEFSQFKKKYEKPITEILIDSEDQFDISKLSYGKNEKATLVFFTYPLPSVKILIKLSNDQLITKNVKIIGASSWNDEVSLLKPVKQILEQAKEVVAVDVINWNVIKKSSFVKRFIKEFGREPLSAEIINYDITRFTILCYKQSLVNKKYNINKFQYCITHATYHGASGTFSFNKHSSFANRPLYITNILDRM